MHSLRGPRDDDIKSKFKEYVKFSIRIQLMENIQEQILNKYLTY